MTPLEEALKETVATWRRLPEDPVAPARWVLRWNKRYRGFDWPKVPGLLFATVVALGILSVVQRATGRPFGVGAIVGQLTLAFFGLWKFRRPEAELHAALPTLADGYDALPVTLEIREGGRLTGRETGWVAFADGWLVYQGLRTDFSLKPEDAFAVRRDDATTELDLLDHRRVRLTPLEDAAATQAPATKADRDRLEAQVAAWRRGFNPEGASVLPPQTRHPQIVADRIGHGVALSVASLLAALFAFLGGLPDWPLAFLALAAASLIWTLWRFGVFRCELPGMLSTGTGLSLSRREGRP